MIYVLLISIGISIVTYLFVEENYELNNIKKISISLVILIGSSVLVSRLYYLYDRSYYFISLLLIIFLLVLCSIKDIKDKEVCLKYIGCTIVIGCILLLLNPNITLVDSLLGIVLGGLLLILSKITRGSIGIGDAIVIGTIGFVLGYFVAIIIFFVALVISAIYSLYLLVIKRKSKNTKIPFIPFLLLAMCIMFLF